MSAELADEPELIPADVPATPAVAPENFRQRYVAAVKEMHCPWAEVAPRHRFAEYDEYRSIWCDELWQWLIGENPRQVHSLTAFAWAVQHARLSEGGTRCVCLNWNDRNQRHYLGDGLLQYLGLLKEEVERVYQAEGTSNIERPTSNVE